MNNAFRIESLLAARQFLVPQLLEDRIYFISNLSGHMSLYVMDDGGSVPEPLLPPDIVLQNPHLMDGYSYYLFPKLGQILLLLDDNGDENYQPLVIPLEGGLPEPTFDNAFADYRVHLVHCDAERNLCYLMAESRKEALIEIYQCDLASGERTLLNASPWLPEPAGVNDDHSQIAITDSYTIGDHVLYLWENGEMHLLYGVPLDDRAEGQAVPLNAIHSCHFVNDDQGLLFVSVIFDDTGSLGYLDFAAPGEVQPVTINGIQHSGMGELESLRHLQGNRYTLTYNIDGVSWLYEATYDHANLMLTVDRALTGTGKIANGVLESHYYDKNLDRHILVYSTATAPTQIYTLEGPQRTIAQHTRERILGIPGELLAEGEDASYESHDGLRISARLYLPAASLGFEPPYPLVYYVHGGPQSQERPDFAWFSMPLIQFLTLNGIAVFVPNVRGSSGYGLSYMKQVDRDWGGQDRLDHVHAMHILAADPRVDTNRAGVVGRSYGGYMTLTLAFRHPELWQGAVDMFGPYDLMTFIDRLPETWKPYFKIAVGDPEKDRDQLLEQSPKTYMHQLTAPMLVIQGGNDPRVVERESRDVVEQLRAAGKSVDYLMFEDEGHDVLKFENRVRCYNAITDFFKQTLASGSG